VDLGKGFMEGFIGYFIEGFIGYFINAATILLLGIFCILLAFIPVANEIVFDKMFPQFKSDKK